MPSGRDSFEHLFECVGHLENEKTFGRITVVFTVFIDDPNEAVFFCLWIWNHLV